VKQVEIRCVKGKKKEGLWGLLLTMCMIVILLVLIIQRNFDFA
jgi:uncharacterized integral membrane protein